MTRETYIRNLAHYYVANGETLRWKTATDEERAEAQVIIDELGGCVNYRYVAPPRKPDIYALISEFVTLTRKTDNGPRTLSAVA